MFPLRSKRNTLHLLSRRVAEVPLSRPKKLGMLMLDREERRQTVANPFGVSEDSSSPVRFRRVNIQTSDDVHHCPYPSMEIRSMAFHSTIERRTKVSRESLVKVRALKICIEYDRLYGDTHPDKAPYNSSRYSTLRFSNSYV